MRVTGAKQSEQSEPYFTVVIPTYRRVGLLPDALASVAAQTFTDLEVVVVDDDPETSAAAVVEAFPDLPIRYMVNDQARGGSGARNTGIRAARGQWVAFLDDDDTWLPTKLKKVHDLITRSAEPGPVLVYSGNEKYDFETGTVMASSRPKLRGAALSQLLYRNFVGGMSVAVVKRSVLDDLGGLDERFKALQDMELYVRLAEVGTIDFVDEVLVRIRSSSRERITIDPQKKLQGALLFSRKYDHLIRRYPRLRHRAASRVFTFAVAAGKYDRAASAALWTLAGVFLDPANVNFVIRALMRQLSARAQRGGSLRPTAR